MEINSCFIHLGIFYLTTLDVLTFFFVYSMSGLVDLISWPPRSMCVRTLEASCSEMVPWAAAVTRAPPFKASLHLDGHDEHSFLVFIAVLSAPKVADV